MMTVEAARRNQASDLEKKQQDVTEATAASISDLKSLRKTEDDVTEATAAQMSDLKRPRKTEDDAIEAKVFPMSEKNSPRKAEDDVKGATALQISEANRPRKAKDVVKGAAAAPMSEQNATSGRTVGGIATLAKADAGKAEVAVHAEINSNSVEGVAAMTYSDRNAEKTAGRDANAVARLKRDNCAILVLS